MPTNRHLRRLAITFGVLSLFFGLFLFASGFAGMFIADMLTPHAKGALTIQTESCLPMLHAVIVGLWVVGRLPTTLCLFSMLLAVSVVLFLRRRGCLPRAAIVCLAFASLVGSSLWVPNPIVRWPISILGDHDERELIRGLFPVHIVNPDWINPSDSDVTSRWAFAEVMARGVPAAGIWCVALLAIARLTRPKETANASQSACSPARTRSGK